MSKQAKGSRHGHNSHSYSTSHTGLLLSEDMLVVCNLWQTRSCDLEDSQSYGNIIGFVYCLLFFALFFTLVLFLIWFTNNTIV